MKITWKEDKYAVCAMSMCVIIIISIALLTNGTGDEGDSITHYLYAKYAIEHHENFFNHWAKPFYVLVMCPFAQFGFIGAKLLNVFFSCLSIWLTYLIAKKMEYRWALAVFPLALFYRTFIIVTCSGLTEPLANLMISISLYLVFNKKYIGAAIVMSFLPFVRSEGLFLCGIFGLYFIWMRQWKSISFLLLGHIVYSFAGFYIYKDLLWVFTQIPYAKLSSQYGHGPWVFFFKKMPAITGVANCLLIYSGVLFGLLSIIKAFYNRDIKPVLIDRSFVIIIFIVFFIMHTTFWALGIFGSFGLTRVFVAIASVMILIAVYGAETIDLLLSKLHIPYHRYIFFSALAFTFAYFAFSKSPYAYDIPIDFGLHADQVCDIQARETIKNTYPDYRNYNFFFDAPYLSEVFNVDIFDRKKFRYNNDMDEDGKYPDNSIIIWDDWYSRSERNIPIEKMRNNKSIKEIKTIENKDFWGNTRSVVVFVKKD
jgi:hypothetical protein